MRLTRKGKVCGNLNALTKRFLTFYLLHIFVPDWSFKPSHVFMLYVQSLARMNKKDSWLFWWTLYLTVSSLGRCNRC